MRYAGHREGTELSGHYYAMGKGSESFDKLGAVQLHRLRAHSSTLAVYMTRFGTVKNAQCTFCRNKPEETREHFVLHCTAWRTQRQDWMRALETKLGPLAHENLLTVKKHCSEDEYVAVLLGGTVPDGPSADSALVAKTVRGSYARVLQESACDGLGAMFRARASLLPKPAT